MLKRPNRLSNEKDVTRVLRKGRAVFTNLLGVKALPGERGARATVVVGTKVHKRSTKRNIVKRRIREAFRKLMPGLKGPADIVILAQPEAVGRPQKDLAAALTYALRTLGLL